MRRRWEWFQRRYLCLRAWTQHSFVLIIAGMSYIAIGMTIEFYVPNGPRWESLILAREVMALGLWADIFIAAGALTILASRWPRHSYSWGYMILTGLSAGWSMFYFAGAFFVDNPIANLPSAFFWMLYGIMWWAISGLTDPPWASAVNRGRC